MRKMLIAMDTSENSLKAVRYAAGMIGDNVQITLFHVFYKAAYGGTGGGKQLHHDVSFSGSTGEFNKWLQTQRVAAEEALEQGRRILADGGIKTENVKVKIKESKEGVAQDILNELEDGSYDTVVVGRRGISAARSFFAGSVSSKIFRHAENCTVWVVE